MGASPCSFFVETTAKSTAQVKAQGQVDHGGVWRWGWWWWQRERKKSEIYDAEEDALALMEAMASWPPAADPLIEIFPALSHDQTLELRFEYKRHVTV